MIVNLTEKDLSKKFHFVGNGFKVLRLVRANEKRWDALEADEHTTQMYTPLARSIKYRNPAWALATHADS